MESTTQPLAVVRASSWPTLFDCSYKWYWQNIMGLRSPSGGAAHLGTAVHAGTAVYDQAILDGKFISVGEAVDAARESLQSPEDEVAWDENLSPSDADSFAVKLTTKYCLDIAPTRTYTAVELKCTALDIGTAHGVVRVTGTTDRIRLTEDGRKGASDLKTGGRATEKTEAGTRRAVTKGHHIQLGIYTLMAEQASGERMEAPAEIIGLQTTKDTPCATGELADVKTPLLGDGKFPGLIEIAAGMLKSGVFPPNPKSNLCSRKFCPAYAAHCKYHD
ncbi:PD-(D/E)XK nuclease family protein [Variovorax sp. CAN2819]|uniref:RecB family exonuclease n=1 Tax=Variovorax sp. CAN15 TaxID=3046727 RepID=UPI002649CCDB|nr:PD-(D/E)XK nuclease family protein [Variovorax sp. CAN15]MDN6885329.1 PD-(D/E)XK nuclease family protein [Variovorax sp. CAN15]